MTRAEETGMWNLVMFDLPVKTASQRRDATQFRKLLLDLGWSMEQYSVYVRYVPTGMSVIPEVQVIQAQVPPQGKVQIVGITDRQWAKAIRFFNATPEQQLEPPAQLTIF